MICRVDQVLKVRGITSFLCYKPITSFQGHHCYVSFSSPNEVGGERHRVNLMDKKMKRGKATSIWKPLSVQSCDFEVKVIGSSSIHSVITSEQVGNELDQNVQQMDQFTQEMVPLEPVDLCGIFQMRASECRRYGSGQTEALDESQSVATAQIESSERRILPMEANCSKLESDTVESVQKVKAKTEALRYEVQKVMDSRSSSSIEVTSSLVRFIKGRGGDTQKSIEEDTGVQLHYSLDKNYSQITVEGTSAENVDNAMKRIQVVIEEAVRSRSLDYSHFISLPLAIHPELVLKLNDFQNSILKTGNCGDEDPDSDSNDEFVDKEDDSRCLVEGSPEIAVKLGARDETVHIKMELDGSDDKLFSMASGLGIDRSVFIKPRTFHLTVLMLKLWNKELVAQAAEVLQMVSPKVKDVLGGRPVFIQLKGLECMKGSPSKARVLYIPVQEVGGEDRLIRACYTIINAYKEAGLVVGLDNFHKLKLHATVMNARHRKRTTKPKKFDGFDARGIFKQYRSQDWGQYQIREAHLSQRFVFNEDGYYHCCASIPF